MKSLFWFTCARLYQHQSWRQGCFMSHLITRVSPYPHVPPETMRSSPSLLFSWWSSLRWPWFLRVPPFPVPQEPALAWESLRTKVSHHEQSRAPDTHEIQPDAKKAVAGGCQCWRNELEHSCQSVLLMIWGESIMWNHDLIQLWVLILFWKKEGFF